MAHAPLNRLAARTLALLALLSALALPGARPVSATPAHAPAKAASDQEIPPATTLVPRGVTNFITANSMVFWYTYCYVNWSTFLGTISRIPVQGGESRQLYNAGNACSSSTLRSNIVADADYLYWFNDNGLVRLSTNATVGDQPQLLSAAAAGTRGLMIDNDVIYIQHVSDPSPTNTYTTTVQQVAKADGTTTNLITRTDSPRFGGFQVSHAFSEVSGASDYLYWLENGTLMRYNLNTGALDKIVNGVNLFYAEGGVTSCDYSHCTTTDRVYFSSGSQILYYNNNDGTITPVHTTAHPIFKLITDGRHLFLYTGFSYGSCSPRCSSFSAFWFLRRGREAPGATVDLGDYHPERLTIANGYLLWQEVDKLRQLPTDVGLPHLYMPVIRR